MFIPRILCQTQTHIMRDLERCKKYLRGVLLAHKGGVLISQIGAKYRDITGETVPYRRFNFNSVDAFLQSIPDVCSMSEHDGGVRVNVKGVGVGTPETKHIEDLIQMKGRIGRGGNYEVESDSDYESLPEV